jgi:hypothetical protein
MLVQCPSILPLTQKVSFLTKHLEGERIQDSLCDRLHFH